MTGWAYFYTTVLTMGAVASAPILGTILATRPKHRAGFVQKATASGFRRDPSRPPPIWYHAVSVGEVMASLPLIRAILEDFPARPLWISTVTATGQSTAQDRIPLAAGTFYFPYDLPWILDRVIHKLQPGLFVTAETELWPNCIWRLHRYGVPMVLVNGRISDRSFRRYARCRFFFRHVLGCLNLLCMESDRSARRIMAMGAPAERVQVTGNLKFDQDLPGPVDQVEWRVRLGLEDRASVVVAGSTHAGEEEVLLGAFRQLRPRCPCMRLVLAPRAPERFDEVLTLIRRLGLEAVRRSDPSGRAFRKGPEVILLDTMGELSKAYAVASVAFVGGSMVPHGGHNPLEAAAHKRPILFGPYMNNFREIAAILVEWGGAKVVSDENELAHWLLQLLTSPAASQEMGRLAFKALMAHRGAAGRTLEAMRPLLERSSCG